MILRKLQYYREGRAEKHLRDIAAMLEVSGATIDREDLDRRAELMGLTREWHLARDHPTD